MTPDPTPPSTIPFLERSLVCVGGGNMAHAVLSRALASGASPTNTVVVEPIAERRALFPIAVAGLPEALERLDDGPFVLMLAVKPQVFSDVAALAADGLEPGRVACAVSVMAGVRASSIRDALPGSPPVIRVMPNTPAAIGEGMSAVSALGDVEPTVLRGVRAMFEATGRVVEIEESLMDAYTALAGSGPAYVFYLAESMIDAGVEMGFDRTNATRIAIQTLKGAALLASTADEGPGELRARVTSPRGTTAAACERLDELGVRDSIVDAIGRARDRGRELGGG